MHKVVTGVVVFVAFLVMDMTSSVVSFLIADKISDAFGEKPIAKDVWGF